MIYTLKKDLNGWKAGDKFSDSDPYVKFSQAVGVLGDWFESDGLKLWRAEYSEDYWYVTSMCNAHITTDARHPADDENFLLNNYFRTEQQAQEAATMIRNLLRELRKING